MNELNPTPASAMAHLNILNCRQIVLSDMQDLRFSRKRRSFHGDGQRSDIRHAIPGTVLSESFHGNSGVLTGSPAAVHQPLTVQPADDWFNGERFLTRYVGEQCVGRRFDVD